MAPAWRANGSHSVFECNSILYHGDRKLLNPWPTSVALNSPLTSVAPTAWRAATASAGTATFPWQRYLVWVGLHVALGVLCKLSPQVATLHVWGTLIVGVSWASTRRKPDDLAAFAAYVMGAEVLWRMSGATAFWEMGKYEVILVLALACQRWRPIRPTAVSIWFIGLLIPASLITLTAVDLESARQQISFNLSGPLAISVCAAFFSRMRVDAASLQTIVRAALLPLFAMSTAVLFGIATAAKLEFGSESNPLLSGGFGPNQVSTAFSAGATLAALTALLLLSKQERTQRLLWLSVAVLFGAQSALTFSRSGMYLACLSVLAAVIVTAKTARLRRAYFVSGLALYLVAMFVVFPIMDDFTQGTLSARFADSQVTGRDLLMKSDLAVWMQNPLFGVGPGMAVEARAAYFMALAAHCEITRILAEHGCFGLAALVVLCVCLWQRLWRVRDVHLRGFLVATASFGLLCMLSNAMRVVAPSFMIGLAFALERPVERSPDHR